MTKEMRNAIPAKGIPHPQGCSPYSTTWEWTSTRLTPCHGLPHPVQAEDTLPELYREAEQNPWIELPYMYQMAWYAIHCEELISACADSNDVEVLCYVGMKRCYGSINTWEKPGESPATIAPIDFSHASTTLRRRVQEFGDTFCDVGVVWSDLSRGIFWWLQYIRSSHMLFKSGKDASYLLIYLADSLGSLATTSFMLTTLVRAK